MRKSDRMKTQSIPFPHSAFISGAKPQTDPSRTVTAPTQPEVCMSFRPVLVILALVLSVASVDAQSDSPVTASADVRRMPPPPTTDLVVAGRTIANWILANQLDSVTANMGPGSNADTVRMELTRFVERLAVRGGNELKVIEEKVVRRNGQYQYWRTSEFQLAPSAVLFRIVLTPDGKYGGFGIGLANEAPPIDP